MDVPPPPQVPWAQVSVLGKEVPHLAVTQFPPLQSKDDVRVSDCSDPLFPFRVLGTQPAPVLPRQGRGPFQVGQLMAEQGRGRGACC